MLKDKLAACLAVLLLFCGFTACGTTVTDGSVRVIAAERTALYGELTAYVLTFENTGDKRFAVNVCAAGAWGLDESGFMQTATLPPQTTSQATFYFRSRSPVSPQTLTVSGFWEN